MAPSTQRQYTLQGKNGFDSLKFNEKASVPELGSNDVLVKMHATSLNYRDLAIPKGMYPFPTRDGVVPCSDGAGVIEAVGNKVTLWKAGDKVVTLFNQGHLSDPITPGVLGGGVGGTVDGGLQEYAVYDQYGLLSLPSNLDFVEGATLTCAGLTAWNALYGIQSKSLQPGDWVLTQGTGGVSIFALQFAKAAGAKVISTTSSKDKEDRLKKLGADHVINYKEDQNWGETAKKLTGAANGCRHIVEVGGPNTMKQSLKAVRMEGTISVIGFLGGAKGDEQPSTLEALSSLCTIRGLLVGSRQQFAEMNAAIESNNIHPVVDDEVFSFEKARDAYEYQWAQKHFGKTCIKIA